MKKAAVLFLILVSINSFAGEIFKIEIGKDYNQYTDRDSKRRIWELERAVYQLQQKVFELEMGKYQPVTVKVEQASWICKTMAMGEKFSATGTSKAIADDAVMEKCKASPRSANGFHCDEATCSQ